MPRVGEALIPGRALLVAAAALGAAFCYAASNVVEQRKAAAAPPEASMRIALLWHLARQPVWWLGILVDLGGFGLQAVALGLGSLVFVQPLLVSSLLFSLVLSARVSGYRLSRADLAWALVLVSSLAVFLIVASPSGGAQLRPFGAWILPVAVIAAIVIASVLVAGRVSHRWRAALLGGAAGMCFGLSSTLMKSFAHLLGVRGVVPTLTRWEPYALGLVVAGGFLTVQSAFQAGDLRSALPTLEVAEPIVASALGLSLMGEQLHANGPPALAAMALSLLGMAISAVLLARTAAGARIALPAGAPDGRDVRARSSGGLRSGGDRPICGG
ncbi:MAG: hypothetical protein JWN46_3938 [Acidimicrobiales bacterium]|nr:hypothetical protein [Acidimicrobiales bacterium]